MTAIVRTVLSVMLTLAASTVALAEGPATKTCPAEPPTKLVGLAKPMAMGTWSGIYCGSTIVGMDPGLARDHGNLLLLTDDGQFLRLQVSDCAHDLSLAQSPEAQALEDATLQIRLTLTVGKSKTDPTSNELMEAKDSTGKVVYRLGQCH